VYVVTLASLTVCMILRRFAGAVGSLLDVPTHTVNMTTLHNTHDLWRSFSMSKHQVYAFFTSARERRLNPINPLQAPAKTTLAQFLAENEGQRCVVVLDVRCAPLS
jgi:hypothetical protein